MTENASAIAQINELNKLFADLAPLYVATPQLNEWLIKYNVAIYQESGYWHVSSIFDTTFLTDIPKSCMYATYGEALIAMLDECIARELSKYKAIVAE